MRKLALALVAATALTALSMPSAEASGGCGPYRHRTAWGYCRPPGQWGWPPGWGGAYVVARPVWGVRYWGGGPYWRHRYYWGYHRHYWHPYRRYW